MESERLKIAIQKNGKLSNPSINFLRSIGLNFNENGRKLVNSCTNCDIDILYLRSSDIPEYVSNGIADFGIVGKNVLVEKELDVQELKFLEFGECSLVIAIPENSDIKSVDEIDGKRIATSYPNTLKNYLKDKSINADIVFMNGSVEIAPALDLADVICDLTQTGRTLEDNDLVAIETILESEAVLICNSFLQSDLKFLNFYNSNIKQL